MGWSKQQTIPQMSCLRCACLEKVLPETWPDIPFKLEECKRFFTKGEQPSEFLTDVLEQKERKSSVSAKD
jgi:hypothetical protein